MKSTICIIGVFFLGLFGWLGFENKVERKAAYIDRKELLFENDLKIREHEKENESLKVEIQRNHEVIENNLQNK